LWRRGRGGAFFGEALGEGAGNKGAREEEEEVDGEDEESVEEEGGERGDEGREVQLLPVTLRHFSSLRKRMGCMLAGRRGAAAQPEQQPLETFSCTTWALD
jgi:hypothetical protein